MEILQQKRERSDLLKTAAIVFDGEMIKAVVDIRPRQNNRSRGIEDDETRTKVDEVVYLWIS